MRRTFTYLILLVCAVSNLRAQYAPAQVTLNNEKYYVYPFRLESWKNDIPPCGLSLPNGKYVAYLTYTFIHLKNNVRKLIVKDTANIRVIFTVVNNQPNGLASFYRKPITPGASAGKMKKWSYQGNLVNGLKEGQWTWRGERNTYIESYKNGVQNGWSYNLGKEPGGYDSIFFIDGKEVGYVKEFDRRGRIESCRYHDTLHVRDSIFEYYKDGKLKLVRDVELAGPLRVNGHTWERMMDRFRYMIRKNEGFSYWREYNKKGELRTLIRLNVPGSFYFDSILYYGVHITVKQVGCPAYCRPTDTCYQIQRTWKNYLSGQNEWYTDYELNERLYHRISINYDEQFKRMDTTEEVVLPFDTTTSRWQFQVDKYENCRSHKTVTYVLPAANYRYNAMFVKGYKDPIILESSDNFLYFTGKGQPRPSENYHKPVVVDSVNKLLLFRDTLIDKKRPIHIIVEQSIKPNNWSFLEEDFPIVDGYLDKPATSFPLTHNSFVMRGRSFRYQRHLSENQSPELVLVNKTPFTGNAMWKPGKRNRFNSKKNLLKLCDDFTYESTFTAKGQYANGKKTGTWAFIENYHGPKKFTTDFKEFFLQHKSVRGLIIMNFMGGFRNGTCETYRYFEPDVWDPMYIPLHGKAVKFLETSCSYENDILEGLTTIYYPTGQVSATANYHKGKLDGEVKRFDYYGNLDYVAHFTNDEPHGEMTTYNGRGKKELCFHFTKGRGDGTFETFSKDKRDMLVIIDTGYMRSKKIFYDNEALKEEIVLTDQQFKARYYILTHDNFFSYSPVSAEAQEFTRNPATDDSVNAKHFTGDYKYYFNTGQLYCKGKIKGMRPAGEWEFYDIAGVLINKVNFKDSIFLYPGTGQPDTILGTLTGYYGNGKPRCTAFVRSLDVNYDCNTHVDKSAFELVLKDNYDYYGKDNCKNGTGPVKQYNENGQLQTTGKIENYGRTGLWKFYDPDGKLNKMGTYANNLKDGVWFEGDLEGLNYEDAACFDKSDPEAVKAFMRNQKELRIKTTIFKNGKILGSEEFEMDMNKD